MASRSRSTMEKNSARGRLVSLMDFHPFSLRLFNRDIVVTSGLSTQFYSQRAKPTKGRLKDLTAARINPGDHGRSVSPARLAKESLCPRVCLVHY